MSEFGKHGVRCDGCGRVSNRKDGEMRDRKTGRLLERICSQGRNCEHDFCGDCHDSNPPPWSCPKCETRPANWADDVRYYYPELCEELGIEP